MKALINKHGVIIALNLEDNFDTLPSLGDRLIDMNELKPCPCCGGVGLVIEKK